MNSTEVIRQRSDKLARQVYGFTLDPDTCELVLDRYEYQERLSHQKRWATLQQWHRNLIDMFKGGIDLSQVPLDQMIIEAAKRNFIKTLRVVKTPTEQKENDTE